MGRREAVLLATGAVLLASSLYFQIFDTFGTTHQALGEYTGVISLSEYTVVRIAQTMAGSFLLVLGWRRSADRGDFSSRFGKPPERPRFRFWTEVGVNEAVGLVIVWSVFVVTQSPFYYLAGFPLAEFEAAGQLVLFVGEFLIAKSTFAMLAEILKRDRGPEP